MSGPQYDRRKTDGPDLGKRLDGWKDIAAFLGKVERTVKRWDADRGLPTHRVPGGGRASVYAYTRELDEWLKSGKALDEDSAAEAAPEEQTGTKPADSARNIPATESEKSPSIRIVAGSEPASHRRLPRNWFLAVCGLLIAGIVGAAVNSPAVRAASEKIAQLLPEMCIRDRLAAARHVAWCGCAQGSVYTELAVIRADYVTAANPCPSFGRGGVLPQIAEITTHAG